MSWFKIKEKIKFYWQAKNAHGLHSPFVFNFYISVKAIIKRVDFILKNPNGFSKKENRIILAILQYLKPANTLILSDEKEVVNAWNTILYDKSNLFFAQDTNTIPLKPINFDLIILSKSLIDNQKTLINKLLPLINNESFVIIPHIYASKTAISKWESLLEEKQISVSMDLFFIGILFFRKESSKQDFQLRF